MKCEYCSIIHSNSRFCSRQCKASWQSINLKGGNNPNYGNHYSDEVKQKISENTKKAMKDLDLSWKYTSSYKERISKLQRGREKYYIKYGHPCKGRTLEDIYGFEKAEKLKEMNRESTILQLKNGRMPNKKTKIETMFKEVLIANSINFEEQKPFKLGISDFYLPDYKAFIFCDGDYWHNYPNGKSRDSKQVEYLESEGFKAYRFWERDIKKNVMGCLKLIQ